ncbi:MAG TPA: 50S ribosomal protein L21 [Gemmatales bacterium]|nr:50S ribosomal protein L21 [Gemmatales bacterium]HMP61206.1 50S ribosomal protein L21 [Gemmatales bacterium]
MYVVFQCGTKQFRVSEGEVVTLDHQDVEIGKSIEFDQVLLVQTNEGTTIGQPYVKGAKVVAEVVDHPSEKYTIGKFRRRKRYVRKVGHRQHYTAVRISQIIPA